MDPSDLVAVGCILCCKVMKHRLRQVNIMFLGSSLLVIASGSMGLPKLIVIKSYDACLGSSSMGCFQDASRLSRRENQSLHIQT